MIVAAKVSKSIQDILKNDPKLQAINTIVERSEYVNMDPDRCPWVGIYRSRVPYDSGTLGRHNKAWDAKPSIRIIVQESSLKSGEDCEDKLDKLLDNITSALWADPKLGGVVNMITGINIEYLYKIDESDTLYYQEAEIVLTTEVRTG